MSSFFSANFEGYFENIDLAHATSYLPTLLAHRPTPHFGLGSHIPAQGASPREYGSLNTKLFGTCYSYFNLSLVLLVNCLYTNENIDGWFTRLVHEIGVNMSFG